VQQLFDIVEGEPELLGAFAKLGTAPASPGSPDSRRRCGWGAEQTAPLVIAQRLRVHPGPPGQPTSTHRAIVNPVPGYEVKPAAVPGEGGSATTLLGAVIAEEGKRIGSTARISRCPRNISGFDGRPGFWGVDGGTDRTGDDAPR
jgi:hypothetical protein